MQPPSWGHAQPVRQIATCRLPVTASVPGVAPIQGYLVENSTNGAVFVSDCLDLQKTFERQVGAVLVAKACVVRRNAKTLVLRSKGRVAA